MSPRSVGDSPSYRGEGGDNEIEADYEREPCGECVRRTERAVERGNPPVLDDTLPEDVTAEDAMIYCEELGCGCECHFPETTPPEDREDDE